MPGLAYIKQSWATSKYAPETGSTSQQAQCSRQVLQTSGQLLQACEPAPQASMHYKAEAQAGSASRHCERALRAVTLQQSDIPSSHYRQAHRRVMPGLAIISHDRLYKKQAGSHCKQVNQRQKQACTPKRKREQALQAGSASAGIASRHTTTTRHPKLAPQAGTQTRDTRACIHQAIMGH